MTFHLNYLFVVIQINTIENIESTKHETSDFPRRSIQLPSMPTHLSLNCDQSLISVTVVRNNCPCALIYQVPSFLSQVCFSCIL